MKEEKTTNTATAAGECIVLTVNHEQLEKLSKHSNIFAFLRRMTENELIFTEVILSQLFGGYLV